MGLASVIVRQEEGRKKGFTFGKYSGGPSEKQLRACVEAVKLTLEEAYRPRQAGEAFELFRRGKAVSEIAKAVGIGRGSVYRALEAAGLKGDSASAMTHSGP